METILIIHGELEYLEGLVKLTRKKKDVETPHTQVAIVMDTLTIKQIYVKQSALQQNSPSSG
jgi:hypothetical protein